MHRIYLNFLDMLFVPCFMWFLPHHVLKDSLVYILTTVNRTQWGFCMVDASENHLFNDLALVLINCGMNESDLNIWFYTFPFITNRLFHTTYSDYGFSSPNSSKILPTSSPIQSPSQPSTFSLYLISPAELESCIRTCTLLVI